MVWSCIVQSLIGSHGYFGVKMEGWEQIEHPYAAGVRLLLLGVCDCTVRLKGLVIMASNEDIVTKSRSTPAWKMEVSYNVGGSQLHDCCLF